MALVEIPTPNGAITFVFEGSRRMGQFLLEDQITLAVPEMQAIPIGSESRTCFFNFRSFMARTKDIQFGPELAEDESNLRLFWEGLGQPRDWAQEWLRFNELVDLTMHDTWLKAYDTVTLALPLAARLELQAEDGTTANPKERRRSKK